MRVLMVTHELPSARNANTIPPIGLQIESLRKCGVNIDVVQLLGKRKIKYLNTYPHYLRSLRDDVDLVHAHYGFCGLLARLQWAKPLVVSFMGDDLLGTPDQQGKIIPSSHLEVLSNRWLAGVVDAVIVKSAEMARVLEPVRAHVVPNGVNLDMFFPMGKKEARGALGWPDDRRYVLFPGNPQEPRKAFPFAEDTIRLAAKSMNETIEIKSMYQVPHEQVPFYMNACDLVVMTSYIEGSPNVVKEAMACNRPIVSVPVGDVVELLEGVDGCIIVERERNGFADAIVRMLQSTNVSQARKAIIQKKLDLDSVARTIISIYNSVLIKPQRRRE